MRRHRFVESVGGTSDYLTGQNEDDRLYAAAKVDIDAAFAIRDLYALRHDDVPVELKDGPVRSTFNPWEEITVSQWAKAYPEQDKLRLPPNPRV